VVLVSDQVGLREPCAKLVVDVAQLREAECMQVIAGRERLHLTEARVVEAPRKNDMPVEPTAPRRDLRKGHAHLKGNPGFLRQNPYGSNRPNGGHHFLVERANQGRLAVKVMGEREPAAGMRLVAIREHPFASLASPQASSGGHRADRCSSINGSTPAPGDSQSS
jgi:hypothetical protein